MRILLEFMLYYIVYIKKKHYLCTRKRMDALAYKKKSPCGLFVGMTRFELATSGPPDRCATGLRHIPML